MVFSYLIFVYSELIAKYATLYLKANGERSNMNSLKNTLPDQCKNDEEDKQEGNKSERKQKLENFIHNYQYIGDLQIKTSTAGKKQEIKNVVKTRQRSR